LSETELVRQCVTFTFTWHTTGPNPCRKCMALNGRVYTGQTIWQPYLTDSQFGPIWDFTADMPLTHGGLGHNCHCILEISVDVDATRLESYKEFQKTLGELQIA
jgi:hypothetical protein